MEERLCASAYEGNENTLHQLLQEDRLVLDRFSLPCFNYNPLNIAIMLGHARFVEAILDQNPELLGNLEDSRRKWSSLHLAAARGHLKMVEVLVHAIPDMCFDTDQDGRNPLHIAAIKGKIEVLELLVHATSFAAREKTKRGETILHLCVKHNQLEALKKLVEALDDDFFLNQKDGDGHTILHLAVIGKQIEIIKYLVTSKIDINATNANGHTALNVVPQNHEERHQQMENSLRQAGALTADEITNQRFNFNKVRRLEQKSKALMVVASLIATMAFQAGVNPTGGVWQDDLTVDSQGNNSMPNNPHTAGQSIMAYQNIQFYRFFISFNTIAFVSSLGTISLLISGLPFRRKRFMWTLYGVMWLTATSIVLSYGISIAFVTPEATKQKPGEVAVVAWAFVSIIYFLGMAGYSTNKWWKIFGRTKWRPRNPVVENQRNGNQVELQIQSS